MVRLHTILVNAAEVLPIIAAALPPPGVAALLASSSRNWFRVLSFILRTVIDVDFYRELIVVKSKALK
jgi:hypothetical protein